MSRGPSSRARSRIRIPGERSRDSSTRCACPACLCTRCRSSVCRTAEVARGLPSQWDRLEVPEDVAREACSRLVVAAFERGAGLLQHLPDLADFPSDVAGPLRGLEGLRHALECVGPGDPGFRLARLLLEDLVPQRLPPRRRWRSLTVRRSRRAP